MSIEVPAPQTSASLPLAPKPSRSITWRSATIGTLMVALVCGITPYNDFVVANTMAVGFYLPVIAVLLTFALVVLINGPLRWLAPARALTTGELGVILAMMLVGCGIPGQGMMRSLIPTLISPFYQGSSDALFWKNFTGMNLPEWLFPVSKSVDGRSSTVMQWFYNRVPTGEQAPYTAWIVPLCGWGVFMFTMIATMFALASIITPQWAVNERLPFPIAQIQEALIESPPPGKMLNDLFRSRLFWIAVVAVLFAHSQVTLRGYFPKYVPELKLRYDMKNVLTEEPWIFFTDSLKAARIYFTFVGIAYFISSRVSFSLWAMYLVTELVTVQQKLVGSEMPGGAWQDQHLGSSVAFLVGVIWIGRHHWWRVIRQAVRPDPKWPKYRAAVIVAVVGPAIMVGWLLAVGVQLWVAIFIVAMVLMAHVVVARVVAETGLSFIRILSSPLQVVTSLPAGMFKANDVFFSGVWQINGTHDTRESIFAFMMHGLRVNDSIEGPRKSHKGLIGLMAWAAVFGFVVAASSSIYCYYNYALPLGVGNESMLNQVALQTWPKDILADPLNRWSEGRFAPKPHNVPLQIGIGVVVTSALQYATLRWAWWPFLPVAYLVSMTWYIQLGWLSIFIGWLAKLLIVNYGGATLYQKAKPFFFGLVVGEALAAGLWALVNLMMALGGYDYRVVQLLPY